MAPSCFTLLLLLLLALPFSSSDPTPPPLSTILSRVGLPLPNQQALVFAGFEAYYMREELIALKDYAVSVNQAKRSDGQDGLVVVPGSTWYDGAAGSALIMGVSATFLIDNASLVTDTIVRLGIDIPLSTAEGQPNLPGSRIGGGFWASTVEGPRLNPRRGLIEKNSAKKEGTAAPPPLRGRKLSDASASSDSLPVDAAFLQSWFDLLPAKMQVDAAAWLLSLDGGNLTVTSPQNPLTIASVFLTELFDIELSIRTLAIENQNAASLRLASAMRLGSDGSLAVGVIVDPVYTSFVAATIQQLANIGSAALKLDPASFLRTLVGEVKPQVQPLPLSLTLGFEVLLRAQASLNAGDIASVF